MCVCNTSLTRLCGVGDSCVPHSCITRMPPPASMSAPSASYVVKTLSVSGCFCPPVCLLACLPIYDFFVCRFMCLSFCLSVSVSACLRFFFVSVHVSVCSCLSITLGCRLTTRQPIVVSDLFVFLSVNVCSCVCPMRVCPPVCLSVCLLDAVTGCWFIWCCCPVLSSFARCLSPFWRSSLPPLTSL